MMKHGTLSRKEPEAFIDRLLSERDAAAIIGFSIKYLQKDRLKDTPVIPFTRIGRTVRYRLSTIMNFVNQ